MSFDALPSKEVRESTVVEKLEFLNFLENFELFFVSVPLLFKVELLNDNLKCGREVLQVFLQDV